MMPGVDRQMQQYNAWYTRGCPTSNEKGWDGHFRPAINISQPPVVAGEEDS